MTSGAALLGTTILGGMSANAQPAGTPASAPPAGAMPQGYNILFVLVDQEHFFPKWPFPVPAREAIKKKAITFLNHQAASCVCSSARSVVYTGQHIQHTGIADNLNYVWQRDLATSIKTVGHRLGELGYHAAYQGKWHLPPISIQAKAIDAPLRAYRDTIVLWLQGLLRRRRPDRRHARRLQLRRHDRSPRRSPGCGPRRRRCAPRASPGISR